MTEKTKKVNPHDPLPGLEQPPTYSPSAHDRYYDGGRQLVSPLPIAPPIGYVKTPSLAEQIRAMVRSEKFRQQMEDAGMETFEEADDFEVGDDYDPTSPYEVNFDPAPPRVSAAAPEAPTPAQDGQEAPKRSSEPTPPSSDPGAGGSSS